MRNYSQKQLISFYIVGKHRYKSLLVMFLSFVKKKENMF